MKKIICVLMTICLLGGLFVSPALAFTPTPYGDAFAEAVAEFSDGQYGEFVELIVLARDLENPEDLALVYSEAFNQLSPEMQQRVMQDGFFNNDTQAVVDALAAYVAGVDKTDYTEEDLLALYPNEGILNEAMFVEKMNVDNALEIQLASAYANRSDLQSALSNMKKLLNTTLISGVFETDIFDTVSVANADLALNEVELGKLIDIYNDTLNDDVLGVGTISAAIEKFVDYYNALEDDATNRELIFGYLKDNGLVKIESGNSGGSGGGGGGGAQTPEDAIEEPDEELSPQELIEYKAAVKVKAEVKTQNGKAFAEAIVDGNTVEEALEKSLAVVSEMGDEADGRILQPVLAMEFVSELENEEELERVEISLPLKDLQKAEEKGVKLVVKTGLGDVAFNTESILNGLDIGEDKNPKLDLHMKVLDSTEFPDLELPESALIVDIVFLVNDMPLEHFKAPIEIRIPYIPKKDEKVEEITVFWIDGDGELLPVGGVYNEETGMIKFVTNHLSQYFAQIATKDFSDVADSHWGHDFIATMGGKGYISGYEDGTFRANGEITRAEFIAILTQMYALSGDVSELDFEDVSEEAWYAPYVAAGYGNKIIAGKSTNEFDPNGKISRQEAATMLSNVLSMQGFVPNTEADRLSQFSDQMAISSWARDAVCNSYAHGLFSGRDDGKFAPKENLSRAEAATMLYHLLFLE